MWQSYLNKAVIGLIPFAKRKGKIMAWVRIYVSYIFSIHQALKLQRTDTIRRAYLTPQVSILEKYLNDLFTNPGRIYIEDGELLGPWLFYAENPNVFFLDQADSYVWGVNDQSSFIVYIPLDHNLDPFVQQVIAIVNKYKLPGKSFIIYKYAI